MFSALQRYTRDGAKSKKDVLLTQVQADIRVLCVGLSEWGVANPPHNYPLKFEFRVLTTLTYLRTKLLLRTTTYREQRVNLASYRPYSYAATKKKLRQDADLLIPP